MPSKQKIPEDPGKFMEEEGNSTPKRLRSINVKENSSKEKNPRRK